MIERLESLENEFLELEARLGDPSLVADNARYVKVMRRYSELGAVVKVGRKLREELENLEVAKSLLSEADAAERAELRSEMEGTESEIEELERQFRVLLLPKDPNEGRDVIVEIRGAEGGEEANLFAKDLFEMYSGYASSIGWKMEVLGGHESDMGGYTDVAFILRGEGVWTRMKFEGGPHRVQRVPVTESQGRIHTSSATVTVLPEAEEVDFEIDQNDLQIDTYRSSGAGGQHVNTTDSAVRITHMPTGVTVSMQDEKSQLRNRALAMVVLRSRLLKREQDRIAAEASAARRDQVGGGGRSEKIRTYNYKENRVTEHRLGLSIYKLERVLAGELDEISDALVADERARQLQSDD